MDRKYDFIVYIGRFQPFHDGHMTTLNQAVEAGKEVIVVIGSANAARTPKNPWTAMERQEMIANSAYEAGIDVSKLSFIHVEDRRYKDEKWVSYIQSTVSEIVRAKVRGNVGIALIGHEKDSSSYYLKQNFPFWDFVETGPYIKEHGENGKVVSSTKVRELMFEGHVGYTESNLPRIVYHNLIEFTHSEVFKQLKEEYNHAVAEEKVYESLPYGMNFTTADSVVVQSGHVLLVKRGNLPGKGLWALPGVHVDQNETVLDASIRALVDETHLKVPVKVLKGSVKEVKLFDHPDRSLRARLTQKFARTLTVAHYFQLDSSQPLPTNVRGGEGIEKAWWFPFSEIRKMRDQLFEDHADILDYFIG